MMLGQFSKHCHGLTFLGLQIKESGAMRKEEEEEEEEEKFE